LPLLGYMLGIEAVDYCVYRMQKMNMNSFLDNVEGEIKNRLKVKLWAAVQAGNIEKSEAILNLLHKLLGKDKADPSENLINLLQSAFGSKP